MGKLEDLTAKARVSGLDPGGVVEVVAADWHGDSALTVTYRDAAGRPQERLVYRSEEGTFDVVEGGRRWSFDGDGHLFRLAAEARRIHLAHLFDPMVAVSTSTIEPLPHQIQAVYGEMLPRLPLRFLLADDPGAGKTIMAGLYIKELMLRGDVARCLIVAPGGLVTQWQDELYEKFGLSFDILTRDRLDASYSGDVFAESDRLIARIDQLSRRPELVERLEHVDWDLVVVDEAHRMSAHYFGDEVKETKRFQLGKVLGASTRHFLLMTATPHAGKEEDFQLFLSLLDSDRFEGRFRDGVRSVETSDLMRRMVKENLLRFDGRALFPERRAYTVPYPLSPLEMRLYDEVTEYVREEMNRADRLTAEGEGRRGNTVGFALTVLQRRLASSPEAIYRSLRRRRRRLEQKLVDAKATRRRAQQQAGPDPAPPPATSTPEASVDIDDIEDLDSAELEELEEDVVDAASAARTVAELEAEIAILGRLADLAAQVRRAGTDRKWTELAEMLSNEPEMFESDGTRRKMIVFSEHRDTLEYLVDRLRTFLGDPAAVVTIHGGTGREERRRVQEAFMQDPATSILVATDAAGEGLNLQRAHLVINYDLPWNPNRIEQRFGRVHRIGQEEVCHMWNLVAEDTREAQVYLRLLDKVEQQRKAYRGQVFDVLGQAMPGAELRRLMIDAIRYGDRPEVKARLEEVIDARIGDGLDKLIAEEALTSEVLTPSEIERIRVTMEEAQARRLQPHYVRSFFISAFEHLGGRIRPREPGRYEITHVPAAIRNRDRSIGVGGPVIQRYQRVVFDKDLVRVEGAPPAELIAPGHSLLGAVIDLILERHSDLFTRGAVFVDESDRGRVGRDPRVMVMLEHAIADARPTRTEPHTVVSRRFEFVEVSEESAPVSAGAAPYLDYRPVEAEELVRLAPVLDAEWLRTDIDDLGRSHAIASCVPGHLDMVRGRATTRVERIRAAVKDRLTREINHWDHRAAELRLQADAGKQPRMNPDRAAARADELARRLEARMHTLDQEESLKAMPPVVVGGALVVPAALLAPDVVSAETSPGQYAVETAEVERRAVDAVLAAERSLGNDAVDMNVANPNNPGYDVRSITPYGEVRFIEVKGRISGAWNVTATRNEVLTGLNAADRYILALVEVRPEGGEVVRYIVDPFTSTDDVVFEMTSVNLPWDKMWERGDPPEQG